MQGPVICVSGMWLLKLYVKQNKASATSHAPGTALLVTEQLIIH